MDTLFFVASKVLSFAEQPLNYVFILLFAGATAGLWSRTRVAFGFNLAAIALLALIGVKFVPDWLVKKLEDTCANRPTDIENFRGLVVLGGGVEGGLIPMERNDTVLNDAAERVTKALELARQYPHLQVIYTGFTSRIFPEGIAASEAAGDFFVKQGLARSRVTLQSRSRNTYEDAVFAARLPGVNVKERWLLVTSAAHMPRSLRTFRKQGWNVTPFSTDFRTGENLSILEYTIAGGAQRWELALHELIGLVAYKATGRI